MHHDLNRIYGALNLVYFDSTIDLSIGWFKVTAPRGGGRNGMTYGYYDYENSAVKISPVLNSPKVPGYAINYIVYHELVHSLYPPVLAKAANGKSYFEWHHDGFLKAEARFAHIGRAQHWFQKNEPWLFRSRCEDHYVIRDEDDMDEAA